MRRFGLLTCWLLLAGLLVCCRTAPAPVVMPATAPTRPSTATPSPPTVPMVSTLAGSGKVGYLGGGYQDGPTASALFRQPCALAMDGAGNLYVADMKNQRIRMLRTDGRVLTLAGSGPAGPLMGGYVDGPASTARFAEPTGLCVAPDGSVYVADADNHRIRRISPQGEVTTVAGSGASGLILGRYADGPALKACFNRPYDLVMVGDGDLCVVDFFNHAIRRITPDGQVSTFVGSGVWGRKDGTGQNAELAYPNRIARDQYGNLYVTEGHSRDEYERPSGNHVRKVTADGTVTTIAGSGKPDYRDGPGMLAQMDTPMGLDVDSRGNLYVADYLNHCIRVLTPDGYMHTLAGAPRLQGYQDGPAASALFAYPMDVLVDEPMGLLYVADVGNHRIRAITLP